MTVPTPSTFTQGDPRSATSVDANERLSRALLNGMLSPANSTPASVSARTGLPLVSVVIPARNEGRYIHRCLDALFAQDYPVDQMEILVVDGRSTDRTRDLVRDLMLVHPNLRLIDNPSGNTPSALNIGIRAAEGEVIVRVDGHAVVAANYLSECVRALEETGAETVGGPQRSRGIGYWGRAIGRAMRSPFAGPAKYHYATEAQYVDTVYLGAWRKETLERVGLFDEQLLRNQDYELNYRIRSSGGKVYFTPSIQSDYYCRESLRALARQYWFYGRSKGPVLALHPKSLQPRHLAAPTFVLGLVGGLGLAFLGQPLPLLGLLALYGIATAIFTRRVSKDASVGERVAIMIAFSCMHLSWGSGLLFDLAARLFGNGVPNAPATAVEGKF